MKAECQNVTTKKLENFSGEQTFIVKEHSNDTNIEELYLRRIKNMYYVYALGRNGEPQTNKDVNVTLKHCDYANTTTANLKLNR